MYRVDQILLLKVKKVAAFAFATLCPFATANVKSQKFLYIKQTVCSSRKTIYYTYVMI